MSNVYDQQYIDIRREAVDPCLSSPKRRDLFRCLESACGFELIILSSPPKALHRRTGRWLPAVETRFSTHRQLFCANWDVPKLRIPLSWFFYAAHVRRQLRSGDIVVLDNFEFLYVMASVWARLFRRVRFVLDYEDGKHLIDKGWPRVLSGLAEALGKPWLRAALVAHPALARRLPAQLPVALVPGFIARRRAELPTVTTTPECLNLLYSGSLDHVRGIDLALEALPLLPEAGWCLHVTGAGMLQPLVESIAAEQRWKEKLHYHGFLTEDEYAALVARCHVGLNCQRQSMPESAATFPSKVFSYLSAGLLVVSSRASEVPAICGQACHYFDGESAPQLAQALKRVLVEYPALSSACVGALAVQQYSTADTALRIQDTFAKAGLL